VRIAIAVASALLVSIATRDAAAKEKARLLYVRDATAETCPDEPAFRERVAAKLGYEAFDDQAAARIVTVRIGLERGELEAVVITSATKEAAAGERRVRSAARDCRELAEALAFTVALVVDPRAATGAPDRPAPAPDPAEKGPSPFDDRPAPAPPPSPPSPPANEDRLGIAASLEATGSAGAVPSATFGGGGGVFLVAKAWALGLEGRVDLPAAAEDGPRRVEATLYSGSFVPCGRIAPVLVCGVASFGALSGTSSGAASSDTTFYAAVGPRLGVWIPVTGPLHVGAHADVLFQIARTRLAVGGVEVWSSPVAAGVLGIGAVVHFR
jgi:hypothetical protein